MTRRIAIVDPRPDLLDFLKERIEARGYAVITCLSEREADALVPEPDLMLVDFEKQVDLADVFQVIDEVLTPA